LPGAPGISKPKFGELGVAGVAEPLAHLVGGFRLRQTADPAAQEILATRIRQAEKVVRRSLADRRGARHHRVRVDQFGGLVGRTAHFAVVAVLVLRAALRTLALDKAVRQEHFLDRVIRLFDIACVDQARVLERRIDGFAQNPVLFGVG
jgi:hypothetical protein